MRHKKAGFRRPVLCRAALLQAEGLCPTLFYLGTNIHTPGRWMERLELAGTFGHSRTAHSPCHGRGARDAVGLTKWGGERAHCHMSMKSVALLPCINCSSLTKCSRKATRAGSSS